jgi:hypothetical protein
MSMAICHLSLDLNRFTASQYAVFWVLWILPSGVSGSSVSKIGRLNSPDYRVRRLSSGPRTSDATHV